MGDYINNRYSANTRLFVSYEVGVMLGVTESNPVHREV